MNRQNPALTEENNKMRGNLISVIIPTRNRQLYAERTIRQICDLHLDIQVVVQDNSDDGSLRNMILDLIENDSIDYSYESEPLPFSENYDRAAMRANGKFLCAIGDDDGVLPDIIECALWMEKEGIDAVKPAKDLLYCHPGNKNKKLNACLGISYYSGGYRFSNPEVGVIELLNDGGCNYLRKDLIGSYHGLVRMDLMNKVKEYTGKYYGGLTPDMYSVICLSLIPGVRFAVIDYPITLPGVCASSGSAASETGKHVGKIEDAPHLKYLPNYEWDSRVPSYYSVETIWAETMIKAIIAMKREDLIERYFNREALAYYLYFYNVKKRGEILQMLSPELAEYVSKTFRPSSKEEKLYKLANRAIIKLSRKRIVYRHIDTISKAVDLTIKCLERRDTKAPWN